MAASPGNSGNPYHSIFLEMKNKQREIGMRSERRRQKDLLRIKKALFLFRSEFREALFKDFRKPFTETDLTEIYPVLSEIRAAQSNLRNWMRPQKVENGVAFTGTNSKIIRVAKGVCLIISPWNYPVLLSLGPLISAIAAGNAVIIKPSEHTHKTSEVLQKFIRSLFPENEVAVVNGGKETAEKLMELSFDHIFFTGGTETGKKIMRAAADHLSPVTLELGGKSPVYVHHDCDVNDAASKIIAAKLVNSGQSCVAPDYILAHKDVVDELIPALQKKIKIYYDPEKPNERKNYASVINEFHFKRLLKLSGRSASQSEIQELIFRPELVKNIPLNHNLMEEEIFGPVLPIISVFNDSEAIKKIHSFHEPLGIYVFTQDKNVRKNFLRSTRSGSLCFNDCAVHFLHPGLPFGGIGKSGIGRSHGKAGFLNFSQERVIFTQRTGLTMAKFLYPPYNKIKLKLIEILLKYF